MRRLELQPILKSGGYREDGYWIWCGSPILGDDGRYHLFASRWPKDGPFHPGWLCRSTIVRATADRPEGPYEFEEVVLGQRDPSYFDGQTCHNPCIRKHGEHYLLYYMGCTFSEDPREVEQSKPGGELYCRTWSNKRIGLAISKSVLGPWERPAAPILEPRPGSWDAIATTNPAPWVHEDGSVTMVYKSRTSFAGSRLLGIARAPHWRGPYIAISSEPLFSGWDLEDACLWKEDDGYHLILKDMDGSAGGEAGGLISASSINGETWELDAPCLVHGKSIIYDDGTRFTAGNFERPQVLFDSKTGKATHLVAAVSDGATGIGDAQNTWNVVARFR